MSNLIPNSYLLLQSQYLKKEDRHNNLVWSSSHDGWLIPIQHKDLLKKYEDRFEYKEIYDDIINESKQVQNLFFSRKIAIEKNKTNFLEIERYCHSLGKTINELKLSGDIYISSKNEEYGIIQQQIEQIDRDIRHFRGKSSTQQTKSFVYNPLSFSDVLNLPPKNWLVDQIFGPGDIGMIFGPSGCGKTFVVIDFILKLCSGKKWAHRFEVKRPLNVAYCAGEGFGGLPSRFRAAAAHHRITNLDNFTYYQSVPQLFSQDNESSMVQFIHEWTARQDAGEAQPLDLLVIDTLHTAISGADENSSKDAKEIMGSCLLASKALGCAILLVHHTNKMESGERGSSGFRGACDFILKVKKLEKVGSTNAILECSKTKDGEYWTPQNFNLAPVEDIDSVHVAWDTIPSDEEASRSNDYYKDKIMSVFEQYPDEKFVCHALAVIIEKDDKFTNKKLNDLVNEGRCIRNLKDSKSGKSSINPWVYCKNPTLMS